MGFENDEKIRRITFLRYYSVFNVDCVEGVKLKLPTRYVNDPIECCETIINDMPSKPIIEHGGDGRYYNWREDRVKVPHRENFILSDEYYATLFHKLAHNNDYAAPDWLSIFISASPVLAYGIIYKFSRKLRSLSSGL